MFGAVRLRLIAYVVGVLALVLVAVGALVYALLARQLDDAVDTRLRDVASRRTSFASAPGSAAVADGEAAGDGVFAVWLVAEGIGHKRLPAARRGEAGARSDGWQEVARSGSVPAGLPDMTVVAAARPGRDDWRTVTVDGQRYRLLTRAAGPQGWPLTALQVGVSLAERDRQERIVLLALAGGGALGLALTIAGGLFLTGRALAPVRLAFERQRRFVGDASHELRTPLALLRLEAEDLSHRLDEQHADLSRNVGTSDAGPAAATTSADLRPLLRQLDRVSRLVDDLLTLARLDEGAVPLEREPVPVAPLLHTAAEQARRLAAPGVAVESGALPDLWVSADPDRLHQVLLILVDNAARATPAGGTITLSAARDGRAIAITVADTGAGIPPEHQARVFERFYRVDRARSRQEGGAGLGLAIARDIVRAHGGEIGLESAPGRGTRVTVRLAAISVPTGAVDDRSIDTGSRRAEEATARQ